MLKADEARALTKKSNKSSSFDDKKKTATFKRILKEVEKLIKGAAKNGINEVFASFDRLSMASGIEPSMKPYPNEDPWIDLEWFAVLETVLEDNGYKVSHTYLAESAAWGIEIKW